MGLVGPSCCFIQSRLDESGVCSALHKLREIKKGKKKKVKVTNKHKKYVMQHNNLKFIHKISQIDYKAPSKDSISKDRMAEPIHRF